VEPTNPAACFHVNSKEFSNMSGGEQSISESEFYMWRAIFAFTYVDNMLSMEEQELLQSYLANVPFSSKQRIILKDDLRNPKDVVELHKKITNPEDKKRFCVLARAIVWCEGDMDMQEKAILKKVSCIKGKEEEDILSSTRNDVNVEAYYNQYAKSGMMGLFKTPNIVEMRV
jgi:hypothetical protein